MKKGSDPCLTPIESNGRERAFEILRLRTVLSDKAADHRRDRESEQKTSGGNSHPRLSGIQAPSSEGRPIGSGLDELGPIDDRLPLQRNPVICRDFQHLARHEDAAIYERPGDRIECDGVLAHDRLGT